MKLKYISTALPVAALSCLAFLLPSTVKAKEEVAKVAESKILEADIKHPLKPFLWKVEGKDLTKPSYLFGTMHISDPSVATMHPAAQKAFDEAEFFYAEVDMSMENQMAGVGVMMRNDGKTLNESIGADLSAKLDKELQLINPQLNSVPFQQMKTWLVGILPVMLPDQLAGKKAFDLQLWEAATAANKKTAGIETMEAQMRGFNSLTEAEQVTFLELSLKALAQDRELEVSMMDQMKKAYIAGDETKIIDLVFASSKEMLSGENKELGQKIIDGVLIARDKTMSESILKALKGAPENSHFFAAGTAHYCSEKSIRFYLEEAGYTVTRVEK